MKKRTRNLMLLALGLTMAASVTMVACDSLGLGGGNDVIPFVKEEKKKGPQFLEGALADVNVNDTIVLAEYIEATAEEYTLKITNADGKEERIMGGNWYPEAPGVYTLTYTIHSGRQKGTNTFTFNVTYPELSWLFTLQNNPYIVGQEMVFDEYFNEMNIFVNYPGPSYEIKMESVTVDDVVTNLENQTSYTFASMSDHTFSFYVEASDGQRCTGREVISMKSIDADYLARLTDMGITMEGELYVEDGNFTMVKGSYQGGRNNGAVLTDAMKPHVLSYLAYNGDYGLGDFVKVDFTGKNMPLFSFFRDTYSRSAFDGTKGWSFSGGFTNNSGTPLHPTMNDGARIYGPNMIGKYDEDRDDTRSWGGMTGTKEAPYPGSFNSFDENTRYRMICGFSSLKKDRVGLLNYNAENDAGKYNHLNMDASGRVDTLKLTFECLILNLDTHEIFSRFTLDTYGIQACRYDNIPLETENNPYFKGNIVLYGQYGRTTTFDAIYPIISGKSFEQICLEEAPLATFKDTAPSSVKFGTAANVSDFVDITSDDYTFFYRNSSGEDTVVTGSTFTVSKPGLYTLFYKYDEFYYGEWEVFVGDSKYNATEENGKIVLGAGSIGDGASYAKGEQLTGYVDQAYYAIEGNYALDDYIALDFTGKNLPEIAFFAQNYNNSMYASGTKKRGIVVVTGITSWDGKEIVSLSSKEAGTIINYDFPYMIQDSTSGNFCQSAQKDSALGRANLVDGVHYRLIMGFTQHTDSRAIDLKWSLINLDTNAVVEESHLNTWNFFTGSNAQVGNMTVSDLVGSIVLYGKFGTECTIDKLHGVYENTTIDAVKAAISNN